MSVEHNEHRCASWCWCSPQHTKQGYPAVFQCLSHYDLMGGALSLNGQGIYGLANGLGIYD